MQLSVVKIVVFLFFGAVTTVAVAWVCAIDRHGQPLTPSQIQTNRVWDQSRVFVPPKSEWMAIVELSATGHTERSYFSLRNDLFTPASPRLELDTTSVPGSRRGSTEWIGIRQTMEYNIWNSARQAREDKCLGEWRMAARRSLGLPFRALTGEERFLVDESSGNVLRQVLGAICLPQTKRSVEPIPPLPILPLWPGFALDAIIYAVALWTLSSMPFVLRRLIRRRRGRCIHCGYDLRGTLSQGCPECGKR